MSVFATLGLAALIFGAGCAERESTVPTAPEPAGKLVVTKHKAGGRKERPRRPTSGMLVMEPLRFDQPLVVERTTGKVHLQLAEIQDSRCPEGVACIWEGEARVTILAWDDYEKMQHRLTLTLGDPRESRGYTGKHTVHLMAVNPYPRSEQPTSREDYVVLLGVTATAEEGEIIKY
jgi:hypothetical protein